MDGGAGAEVVGGGSPDFGEGVSAVVVAESGTAVSGDWIVAELRDRLARFKQPKHVFLVDALPRNAMGKVQKKELRERYADVFKE